MAQSETTGLRLLVLDGGDIRCLSQLSILEEFLHQVQWKRKSDEILLPCDYFHMICATGPAGMIAIFLVVFRMSIEEAKDEFVRIWNAVFADDSFNLEERSSKLEAIIEELLRRHNMPLDRKLLHNASNETCNGFVCAISPAAPTACQKFRTYRSPQRHIDISIVEAIRATCATPNRFTSVKVKSSSREVEHTLGNSGLLSSSHDAQEFVTGDDILQNPSREAIKELHELYGAERKVACVLSLGCGRPSTLNVGTLKNHGQGGSWMTGMLQAERVAEELDAQIGRSQVYYRFSVDRGLESPKSIPSSSLGTIETHTRVYLQQINKSRDMQNCVIACEGASYALLGDLYSTPVRTFGSTHGLPPLCASFVMRQEVMDSMTRCMFNLDEDSPKIMILSGMGGSGKTQLISKFALTHLDRFQHVLFIDARTTENIKNGIISRVKSLGGVCTTFEEALDCLSQIGPGSFGPWFLILDNADDPGLELGPAIPNCKYGFVAITTRNPTVGDLNPQGHIKLDVMSEAEALHALLKTVYDSVEQASNSDRSDGVVLVKELGFLPVAIVQAGSYIKRQGRGRMRDYLVKLKVHRRKLLSIPAKSQLDSHHHAVYAALDVTLDVLSTPAKDMLGILACFNYTGFPLQLLDRAVDREFLYQAFELFDRPPEFPESVQFVKEILDPPELPELNVIAELEQFSLLVRVENYSMTTLRFHPLTHAWMSDRITAQEEKKYRNAAMRLFACGMSEEDEDLFEYLYSQLTSLSPTWNNAHWNDLAATARLHVWKGDRSTAITIWEILDRKATQVYGETHLRTTVTKLQLALAYDVKSSWLTQREVLKMIEEVAATRRQALPLHHPDTLDALNMLLEVKMLEPVWISNRNLSQRVDAIKRLQQFPERDCKLLTLKSKEVLAKMYQSQEQWLEAEALLLEVIQEREELQGTTHLMVLQSKQLLAHLYSTRDGHEDTRTDTGQESVSSAQKLQEELVATRIATQGPFQAETLNAQISLAELYKQTNQHTLAAEIWKQVVESYTSIKGCHDKQTLDSMEQLANSLEKSDQTTEAMTQWIEIVRTYQETPNNTVPSHTIQCLADLAQRLKPRSEIVHWLVQLIGDLKAKGNEYEACEIEKTLAKLLGGLGRYEEAVAQWEKIAQEYEAKGDTQEALQVMLLLAELLPEIGRNDDAVARLEQCIGGWKAQGDNQQAGRAIESLAKLLEKMGRPDDAVTRWEQWIGEWKAQGDSQRADKAMGSLTKLLEKMGRPDDAVTRWEQWIAEWNPEGDNWRFSIARESLAKLLKNMGRPDDAVARWEQWIGEWKAQGDNWRAAVAMGSLAKLLEKMGQLDDAVARREQLIAEWKAEGCNWEAGEAIESLAKLFEKMGRPDDAVARWEQWIAESDNRRAGEAMESLAKLLEKMGRPDDAVARREQLIAKWKAEGDNQQASQAIEALAKLLEKMGRPDDSVARWEQWIAERKAKGDNRRAYEAMESLAKLLEKMGRLDDAKAWRGKRFIQEC